MDIKKNSILKNQSGAALVIALIMMIVLTLIGLASIFSSTFEIRLSGNKRGSTDAFYSADSGVQAAMANVSNFNLPNYGADNKYNYSSDLNNYNPTKAEIIISHDTTQTGAPRGSEMSATGQYEFVHYLIESTGQDRTELSPIKSTCKIQQKVVRVIPTEQGGN